MTFNTLSLSSRKKLERLARWLDVGCWMLDIEFSSGESKQILLLKIWQDIKHKKLNDISLPK